MKSPPRSPLLTFWLVLLLLCGSANPLRADVSGLFTYQVIGGTQVTITDYPDNAAGAVTIPENIVSLPVTSISYDAFRDCTGLTSVTLPASVTSIGRYAFSDCTGLTSVTLPASVTSIGGAAFSGCTGLTSVTLPASVTSIGDAAFSGCTGLTSFAVTPGNAHFSSEDGLLYNASGTSLLFFPAARTGGYSIPASITTIGDYAFYFCTRLTSVTLPASVTTIGNVAFYGCTGLKSAVFQGNAPGGFGGSVFANTAPGFTVYYFTNRTGFTSPTWKGYPSIGLTAPLPPTASWLLAHGMPYNTNLKQDPDGDGVSLLMAYALNLDPRQNLQGLLPTPVLGNDSLSIRYYAATPGITYRVETSRDLSQWTTTGVTLSALDAENQRTASVPRDAAGQFLRLVVQ